MRLSADSRKVGPRFGKIEAILARVDAIAIHPKRALSSILARDSSKVFVFLHRNYLHPSKLATSVSGLRQDQWRTMFPSARVISILIGRASFRPPQLPAYFQRIEIKVRADKSHPWYTSLYTM